MESGYLKCDRSEHARIGWIFTIVALLHLLGWGLFLLYAPRLPAMAGMGALAYGLGLRHAFDADHISAIDDTTRFLLQKGKRPLSAGLFFSLGHSTIVMIMTVALILATTTVRSAMPGLETYGGIIGAGVSGVFLWLIGILNLLVLADILRIWRRMKHGFYQQEHLDELLMRRGMIRRLLGGRFQDAIGESWQMYPVGLLFGLGFDTASEIGLLALAAGAASQSVPMLAAMSLAILFAAGMSLMDTADGVFMVTAYSWAFSSPARKIYYNITTTTLSVAVALLIGTIELLQVLATELNWHGWVSNSLQRLDFESLGYLIVALFVLGWACSVFVWKLRGMDESPHATL